MRRHSSRRQRTLAQATRVSGIGYLTGATVTLHFLPAGPNTGVRFVRTDLPGRPEVPARVGYVTGTRRRTTLGCGNAEVSLVEHVLAALAGLRIDNCTVELDAPEPPGLDGSARAFVEALTEAGIVGQPARRQCYVVDEPLILAVGGATLALHPSDQEGLRLTYFLDYGAFSPLGRQCHSLDLTPASFVSELASCRTFLLREEAEEMRRNGLGSNTAFADLLVFGPQGVIGNKLRFADEPARHKVLDLVGDLSLLGADLCGHVVAYRSGHPLNVELARALRQRLSGVRMMAA
jgi:UDP-3-O-[3-hydroxymyristoyl] N-acetylglucosamine deacetylase